MLWSCSLLRLSNFQLLEDSNNLLLAQNYRYDVPLERLPELLRHVVPADGVLEGQVEHVLLGDISPAVARLLLFALEAV